jgi:hypothetical protein
MNEDTDMQIKTDGNTLLCPHCSDPWLHHGTITTYGRSEDDTRTQLTKVTGRETTVNNVLSENSGNPSDRRDGLRIAFWCEICENKSELTIAQHKGETFIKWELVDGTNT